MGFDFDRATKRRQIDRSGYLDVGYRYRPSAGAAILRENRTVFVQHRRAAREAAVAILKALPPEDQKRINRAYREARLSGDPAAENYADWLANHGLSLQ